MCFKRTMKIFLIALVAPIVICDSENLKLELPENDYVLRSCMSSVELSRRNVDAQTQKSLVTPEIPRGRILPDMESLTRSRIKSNGPSREKAWTKSYGVTRRRPGKRMLTDTPLFTLNLQRRGRKDAPQPFTRNKNLPEVRRNSKVHKKKDNKEASIILIGLA